MERWSYQKKTDSNCALCHESIQPLGGVQLQKCQHTFCKPCLHSYLIENLDYFRMRCPVRLCSRDGQVLLTEIKTVLSQPEYLFHLEASGRLSHNVPTVDIGIGKQRTSNGNDDAFRASTTALFERHDNKATFRAPGASTFNERKSGQQMATVGLEKDEPPANFKTSNDLGIFQCKTSNCAGICIPEDGARIFLCEICNSQNCLRCCTIHGGIPCDRWRILKIEANSFGQSYTDEELLAKSEEFGYKQLTRAAKDLYFDVSEDSIFEASADRQKDFECPICAAMTSEEDTGGGFILQQCGHAFCRSCLENLVSTSEKNPVPCPHHSEDGPCPKALTASEFKDLASEQVYEKHVRWGWSIAGDILQNVFRCLDKSCDGFWEIEDKSPTGIYVCPLCRSENCVKCNTLHLFQSCAEFQEQLRLEIEAERARQEEELRQRLEAERKAAEEKLRQEMEAKRIEEERIRQELERQRAEAAERLRRELEAQRLRDEQNRRSQYENEKLSESQINSLINARQFMRCPHCGFVCEKISGCANVYCLNRACGKHFRWYQ